MAASQSLVARLITSACSSYSYPSLISRPMADGALIDTVIAALQSGHQPRKYFVGTELARGILPTSALLNSLPIYLPTPVSPTGSGTTNPPLAKPECI